jgi:hypothetical protein
VRVPDRHSQLGSSHRDVTLASLPSVERVRLRGAHPAAASRTRSIQAGTTESCMDWRPRRQRYFSSICPFLTTSPKRPHSAARSARIPQASGHPARIRRSSGRWRPRDSARLCSSLLNQQEFLRTAERATLSQRPHSSRNSVASPANSGFGSAADGRPIMATARYLNSKLQIFLRPCRCL